MLASLGARVHLFVHPVHRAHFTALFRDTLQCNVRELDFGMEYPVLLVSFDDGSAFSVEFSGFAPEEPAVADDAHTCRGAWIEFRTQDVANVEKALDDANVPSFSHPGSKHRYFMAPGGQVFRVLDRNYRGP